MAPNMGAEGRSRGAGAVHAPHLAGGRENPGADLHPPLALAYAGVQPMRQNGDRTARELQEFPRMATVEPEGADGPRRDDGPARGDPERSPWRRGWPGG